MDKESTQEEEVLQADRPTQSAGEAQTSVSPSTLGAPVDPAETLPREYFEWITPNFQILNETPVRTM
jgi:hypothetical protein